MASAVIMRRCSWLQSSSHPAENQQPIQDFLFEGTLLFSEQTDVKLHSWKDFRATRKSLGPCAVVPLRKHFSPQQPVHFSALSPYPDLFKKQNRL
ncbi:hypothetical protein UY3_18323 [Chelonia mydas]|uniref:Uncharacterized protein n=1 Tax=Chelonia mydas TaxID=8469 RepID=M7AXW6_CHEMY|nr:hypothetical protein UY3_18323 [Chelonia mydas]